MHLCWQAFKESRETSLDLSPSLSSGQRARVHQMATQLGLEHQSVGQGEGRYLRIAKSAADLLAPSSSLPPASPQDTTESAASAAQMDCEEEEQEEEGEAFGMLRLMAPDASGRGTRGGASGVELVLLPYNFNKLLDLLEQHCTNPAKTHSTNAKMSQVPSVSVAPLSFFLGFPSCARAYTRLYS